MIFHTVFIFFVLFLHVSLSLKIHLSNRYVITDSITSSKEIYGKRFQSVLFARKIDEEEASLNPTALKKTGNKKKYSKSSSTPASRNTPVVDNDPVKTEIDSAATLEQESISSGNIESEVSEYADAVPVSSFYSETASGDSSPVSTMTEGESSESPSRGLFNSMSSSDFGAIKVPREDPLTQSTVPPEVVFFGDPRKSPPIEAAQDPRYHGTLLMWARHATVAPRTSEERLVSVFPRGRRHPQAPVFRLSLEGLTYEKILDGFTAVQDDLEKSKAFIDANIDLVPSRLFIRALTIRKFGYQSRNELDKMEELKGIRRKYQIANDQLFFPLNIEVKKAETRVMTYLSRDELRTFARDWDSAEASLHFVTLLAARLTWDAKVRDKLDYIRLRTERTAQYAREAVRRQLLNREFSKPALTAEVYRNASDKIQSQMPELYARIRPEVRVVHETYFMVDPVEIKRYITTEFCPRPVLGCALDLLRENLKVLDATVAAIQGVNYTGLRLRIRFLYELLCNEVDPARDDNWYQEMLKDGYGFETYEPDEVPAAIEAEQRYRDSGSAVGNFIVDIMKGPTRYTESFSGMRKKGSEVDNWLYRDPAFTGFQVNSAQEVMQEFRKAYITQTNLRLAAEAELMKTVDGRLDLQERLVQSAKEATERQRRSELIMQVSDEEEEEGADNASN